MKMGNLKTLTIEEVVAITGLSASTIKRMEKAGYFPKRRWLSANRIGWFVEDIDERIDFHPLKHTEEGDENNEQIQ